MISKLPCSSLSSSNGSKKRACLGNVMNAFRLTVVGEKGPHMFDITELLGKDETIQRMRAGIERIQPAE